MDQTIEIYTDGSCHPQSNIGAWAAIILFNDQKAIIEGAVMNTNHNRMEIFAVLKAMEFIEAQGLAAHNIQVFTDSQYVTNIPERAETLKKNAFLTRKNTPIQNVDLVQQLIALTELHRINFIKVVAHQKKGDTQNHNREVDKIVRKRLRKEIADGL